MKRPGSRVTLSLMSWGTFGLNFITPEVRKIPWCWRKLIDLKCSDFVTGKSYDTTGIQTRTHGLLALLSRTRSDLWFLKCISREALNHIITVSLGVKIFEKKTYVYSAYLKQHFLWYHVYFQVLKKHFWCQWRSLWWIPMKSNTHVMNVNALQEIRPPNHSS